MNQRKTEVIFIHQNLIFNRLTYLVHAKSTGELIIFGFSDRSVRSLVSAKRSTNRWVQTKKNDFIFWLIFGLSPNLGCVSDRLSEGLIQKVKWPALPLSSDARHSRHTVAYNSWFSWSDRLRHRLWSHDQRRDRNAIIIIIIIIIACSGSITFLRCPSRYPSWCRSRDKVKVAGRAAHDSRRPTRYPCGRVHSSANMATRTRPQAGESIPMQKWNSSQGGQKVHYTDAAAGHQMTWKGSLPV